MKDTFFSIIIPVYNTENFITETINSVLKQNYQNYEIICVNDGSTDNSLEILNSLAKSNSQIQVLDINNSGPANARNMGLKNAKGDYILFLDSDDLMEQNALNLINQKIQSSNNPEVLIFSANVFNATEIPDWVREAITTYNHSKSGDNCYTSIFDEKTATPFIWNKAYNKNFLTANNIFFNTNITIGEDQAFLFRVFECASRIFFFSNVIYNYRWQRQDSLMYKFKKDKLATTKNHLNLIKDVLHNLYYTNKLTIATDQLIQWFVSLLYNSHLKDLEIEDACEIATEFCELLDFYDAITTLKSCFHLDSWNVQNIFAFSVIKYMATYKQPADIDLIVYENLNFNLDNINKFCKAQNNLNYRLVINCFSVGFYNYIKSQNIKNSVVILLPNKTFTEAKNISLKYSSSKYVSIINQKELLNESFDFEKYISLLDKNKQSSAVVFDKTSSYANEERIKYNSLQKIYNLGSVILNRDIININDANINYDGPCSDAQFLIESLSNETIMIIKDDIYNKPLNDKFSWFSQNRHYSSSELCYSLGNLAISAIQLNYEKICNTLWNFVVDNNLINIQQDIQVNENNMHAYANQTYLLPLVEYMLSKDAKADEYKNYLTTLVNKLEDYDDQINSALLVETKNLNNYLTPRILATINKLKQTKIYKWWRTKKYGK